MSGSERREFTRAPVCLRAVVRPRGASAPLEGVSKDVSLRGFFLQCTPPKLASDECDVTLFLSTGNDEISVTVHGKVARTVADGIAIEFTSIELEAFTHLKNLVKMNSDFPDKIDDEVHEHARRSVPPPKR